MSQQLHEFTDKPPVADASQLTELLRPKALVDMNDEELSAHLAHCRAAMETPQTLKKAMSTKAPSAPKAKRATAKDTFLKGLIDSL
jgi:hypothetical protein